ncbi:Beta-1,3-galactosyltransferase 5 [Branchiostoma belcheri]|nr:Beta-1,3-galactosyltransferase 5 [Branchiostoma belcheri]
MVRVRLKLIVKTIFTLCLVGGCLKILTLDLKRKIKKTFPKVCKKDNSTASNYTVDGSNPHDYKFLLNNPEKCAGSDVFLLMMVTSAPKNHAQRFAIRRTWGNENNIEGVVIKTVFAVGMASNASNPIQVGLEQENRVHKDLIQEDFVDSYRNLTLKTVMCLKWASEFCPRAKFVLKADDDTFVNIFNLVRHLGRLNATQAKRFVTGRVYTGGKPVRIARDPTEERWCLAREDFPRETFPRYPGGYAYVISGDITRMVYEVSLTVQYLFIEDVYLGLCLEKLGIEPVYEDGFVFWREAHSCDFDKNFNMASHRFKTPDAMLGAWEGLLSKCRTVKPLLATTPTLRPPGH